MNVPKWYEVLYRMDFKSEKHVERAAFLLEGYNDFIQKMKMPDFMGAPQIDMVDRSKKSITLKSRVYTPLSDLNNVDNILRLSEKMYEAAFSSIGVREVKGYIRPLTGQQS
jgi:hypothetical protein